jgi:hypothetical protein
MATPDAQLTNRLALVRQGLAREFPSVPEKELDDDFSEVVSQLLADARVLDFVPVLARRYTRDRIQRGEAAAEPKAA